MSRLQRLLDQLTACSTAGATRSLSIQFLHGKDWSTVTGFCEALQNDLAWPAPMLSVHPGQGFKVWLVFSEPLAVADAQRLGAALVANYLPENFAKRVLLACDKPEGPQENAEGLWSAFIDPGMGSMFIEQQGLDIEPHPDRQAELLSLVRPISAEAIHRWRIAHETGPVTENASELCLAPQIALEFPVFNDPRLFLQAVMNDTRQAMTDRLRAAELLLQNPI